MDFFRASYVNDDYYNPKRTNHRKRWTAKDENKLIDMFNNRATLRELCEALQRQATSIVEKLYKKKLIWDKFGSAYYCDRKPLEPMPGPKGRLP